MKHIEISDDAYEAIANRHGDVAAYIEQLAQKVAPRETANGAAGDKPERSFYEAARESGMIGKYDDLPPDLSTNPRHMEGFGQ